MMHGLRKRGMWHRRHWRWAFTFRFPESSPSRIATQIKEVAQQVPLERMLVETDAPYLAPVPFRGKLNHPALVRHVAEHIADLRGGIIVRHCAGDHGQFLPPVQAAVHAGSDCVGCGSSAGTPVIGCGCGTCTSVDPRNRRTWSIGCRCG